MLEISFNTSGTRMFIDYSGEHLPYHIPSLWIAECFDRGSTPRHSRVWALAPSAQSMVITPKMLGEKVRTP